MSVIQNKFNKNKRFTDVRISHLSLSFLFSPSLCLFLLRSLRNFYNKNLHSKNQQKIYIPLIFNKYNSEILALIPYKFKP